jgi:hypothetical protein
MATPAKPKRGTAVAVQAKINLPVNIAAQMAAEIEAFKGRIAAPSGDRIKADEKLFTLPNGDTSDTLSVIIVDFVSYNAYYDKPWNSNQIVPPNCFSIGLEPAGMVPSENSPEMQAESCAACWANQWKSSATGAGKACSNTKLLAVIAPDDPDAPLMLLKVTATALKSFDAYVTGVARAFQRPPRGVITEITFDPNPKYSSLRFGNPVACTPDQLALAYSRKDDAMTRLMVEPDVSAFVAAPAAPARGKAPAKARKAA